MAGDRKKAVVKKKGGSVVKLEVRTYKTEPVIIETLEKLLERARKGTLTGIAVVADYAADKSFSTFHSGVDSVQLLGLIRILEARVLNKYRAHWED